MRFPSSSPQTRSPTPSSASATFPTTMGTRSIARPAIPGSISSVSIPAELTMLPERNSITLALTANRDRRHATERQRHQRQNKAINDSGDKKTKRPPSKSHKKKSKPSDLQVNGYHDHDAHKNGSPQEHHAHAKKAKGHRSNQSVSSQLKRSPPFNARPHNHAHPPSPAHTPPDLPNNFQVHGYSENFLALYDQDHPSRVSSSNSFASLPVTNTLALWLQDPEKLQEDAGVDKEDVFQFLTQGDHNQRHDHPMAAIDYSYESASSRSYWRAQWPARFSEGLLQQPRKSLARVSSPPTFRFFPPSTTVIYRHQTRGVYLPLRATQLPGEHEPGDIHRSRERVPFLVNQRTSTCCQRANYDSLGLSISSSTSIQISASPKSE